ncbi:AMP-binding protein [Geoglobus acetivorans]|uniref:AMP-binding protein n=1 Tax=Geoglobus acetivorans TaxID=565033 RepID=A0ABZ3H0L0_GEOAI|nr:AMP-binding protein [Geoglobus acetivorans]
MRTFGNLLERASKLFSDVEVVGPEGRTNYRKLFEDVLKLAGWLKGELGLKKGEVVAVADWNTLEFMKLVYAIPIAGGIVYPVNIRLPPEQILYTLEKSDAKTLIFSRDFELLTKKFEGRHISIDEVGRGEKIQDTTEQQDDAVIMFTSGTTGLPKAVKYSHEKFIDGALSIATQLTTQESPAKLTRNDVIFPQIPMYHIVSWGSVFIAPYLGLKLVLGGKFEPGTVVETIKSEGATWINAVPTMIHMLIESSQDFGGIKALVGGSAVTKKLAEKMKERNIEFSMIYGATDMLAASISIYTSYTRSEDMLREITHPVPFADFKIRKFENSDMGEILFRAPWLPMGYYKDEQKTKESYTEDGWFITGDIGIEMPDGGIKILDRFKDAIKSGGEWIPTSILESVISEIEGVELVAVVGKRDEKWDERPVAIIKAYKEIEKSTVTEYLKKAAEEGRIAKWWIPDEIVFVEDMPLTSTGKISKLELKNRLGW